MKKNLLAVGLFAIFSSLWSPLAHAILDKHRPKTELSGNLEQRQARPALTPAIFEGSYIPDRKAGKDCPHQALTLKWDAAKGSLLVTATNFKFEFEGINQKKEASEDRSADGSFIESIRRESKFNPKTSELSSTQAFGSKGKRGALATNYSDVTSAHLRIVGANRVEFKFKNHCATTASLGLIANSECTEEAYTCVMDLKK